MDFFKSVFANDAEPSSSDPQNQSDSEPNSPNYPSQEPEREQDLDPNPNPDSSAGAWSLGGLIKTLATRSESVIKTYRRDLDEFRSGLKKETAAIRDVASRAVKDLPVSLEAGASVAQESLESVGQAIDDFGSSVWRGTAEIISHGKDALLSADQDSDSSEPQSAAPSASALSSKRYSRFDAQVLGIQSDLGTYSDEPDDFEDFQKWKLGFVLEEKAEEIENLCGESGAVEGIYTKLVPSVIDHETFWSRYFYRIYKLKLAEDTRANLVKRAIAGEDDEDLSWEVEDDDEEETTHVSVDRDLEKKEIAVASEMDAETKPIEVAHVDMGEENSSKGSDDTDFVAEPISGQRSVEKQGLVESGSDDSVAKSDEKMSLEGKTETGESCKDSDFSVVSSQQSGHEEEDLGWDEIEDLGSIDEKKVTAASSPRKDDLHKRLSAADEDEDLSWDIEDDEPVKH